jgi:PEP-CTERM motif
MKFTHAFPVLLLLVVFSRPVHADTIDPTVYRLTATTCVGCFGSQPLPSVHIDAFLSVVQTTGTFWDPFFTAYINQTVLMLTGITGSVSINCMGIAGCAGDGTYALSFVPAIFAGDGWSAPRGDGSYLFLDGLPRYLVFSSVGSGLNTRVINDNAFNLFQWENPVTHFGSQVPLMGGVVQVPEPSSLMLAAAGLLGLLFLRRTVFQD